MSNLSNPSKNKTLRTAPCLLCVLVACVLLAVVVCIAILIYWNNDYSASFQSDAKNDNTSLRAEYPVAQSLDRSKPTLSFDLQSFRQQKSVLNTLNNTRLDEVSGMAMSQLDSKRLWMHNDSGDGSRLYAVNTKGHYLGQLVIDNAQHIDWEDMDAFTIKHQDGIATHYLVIGDIGDNRATRNELVLYFIVEPTIDPTLTTWHANVMHTLTITLPDHARDIESLAVSVKEKKIFLLSKREPIPHLYAVPLPEILLSPKQSNTNIHNPLHSKSSQDGSRSRHKATHLGKLISLNKAIKNSFNTNANTDNNDQTVSRSQELKRPLSNSPTAMTISADERFLLITTYTHQYIYAKPAQQSWAQAFLQIPSVIKTPPLLQAEANAISIIDEQSNQSSSIPFKHLADTIKIYIASEQLPAKLLSFDLKYTNTD